ncbi:LON peptidase substrate-binding domain-containing protein [Leptospira kanakyensis]|nr:LON peptidase substrate-binding domain-containing protein [Leptospira kanakyensis]
MSTFPLPLFPLPDVFLFPGMFLPLHIFEPRYRMMLDFCMENGGEMGMAPYPKNWIGAGLPPIPEVVGYGHIIQKESLPDGRSNIILEGIGTAEIVSLDSTEPFYIAQIVRREHERNKNVPENIKEKIEELLVLTKRILLAEGAEEDLILKMNQILVHPFPVDFIASLIYFDFKTKQTILETTHLETKADLLKTVLLGLNLSE